MRVTFPDKEQDDTLVGAGNLRVGAAADNDIIVSSAKAYVNAVNRMIQTTRSKEGK